MYEWHCRGADRFLHKRRGIIIVNHAHKPGLFILIYIQPLRPTKKVLIYGCIVHASQLGDMEVKAWMCYVGLQKKRDTWRERHGQ